jgi:hypothetical protein
MDGIALHDFLSRATSESVSAEGAHFLQKDALMIANETVRFAEMLDVIGFVSQESREHEVGGHGIVTQ